MKDGFLIVLMVICSARMMAQESPGQALRCQAMAYGDFIRVMWIPGNSGIWEKGIEQGYSLQRKTVRDDGRMLAPAVSAATATVFDPMQCLGYDAWKAVIDTSDQWEVLAAGMVYGDMEYGQPEGDMDISFYLDKEAGQQNRYALSMVAINHSFTAAERMGLAFTDRNVEPGASYAYTVTLADLQDDNTEDVSETALVSENKKTPLPPIPSIQLENKDEGILIAWDTRYISYGYISYTVERKEGNTDTYVKINSSPIMGVDGQSVVSYLDPDVEEGRLYNYRVTGWSPLGGMGPPSDTLQLRRSWVTPLNKPIFHHLSVSGDTTLIRWRYPAIGRDKLYGFNLLFSSTYDGNFTPVNPSLVAHTDSAYYTLSGFPSGYFYIEAVGKDGSTSSSVKRLYNPEDVEPPAIPRQLTCSLDTIGSRISLGWPSNGEGDLLGYRVFYGSEESGQYADYTGGVIDSNGYNFPVKSSSNGESLYFKITAVDNRYNISDLSDYCRVVLPDNTPPASPLIRKVINGDSTIVVEWAVSPSWDVVAHRIERGEENSGEWHTLVVVSTGDDIQQFVDTTAVGGVKYFYRVIAIDPTGNETPGKIRIGRLNDKKLKPEINLLQATYYDRKVTLEWKYLCSDLIQRFIIYRQSGEGDMVTYELLEGEAIREMYHDGRYMYRDPEVREGGVYQYAVRAVWKDGGTSRMSDSIKILAGRK